MHVIQLKKKTGSRYIMAVKWSSQQTYSSVILNLENNNVFIIVIIWNSINTWAYLIEWLLYVPEIVSMLSNLVGFKFMSSYPSMYF